jgi:tetratricopeptide (TPR) repeat protein
LSDHPTPDQLKALTRGELLEPEASSVLAHLYGGCEQCHFALGPFMAALLDQLADIAEPQPGMNEEDDGEFDLLYDRVARTVRNVARRVERERERARVVLPAVLQAEDETELAAVTEEIRGTWAYCELLLECSHELRHRDTQRMLWFAEIAKRAAENLNPKRYGRDAVFDRQALAWAELGNAYRVTDRLGEADHALQIARERSARGSGDPLLRARILGLTAWQRTARRSFGEAVALLDHALGIYRSFGDRHLTGKALIERAFVCIVARDDEPVLDLLREGLSLIDARREPKLALAACHNMLCLMVDRGEFDRARRLLFDNHHLYIQDGDPLNLLKKRWLEGQIAAGLGRLESAERAFRQVKEEFSEAHLPYKAAIVGLELGLVLLRQERSAEVLVLVREIVAVFKVLHIGREALGALLLLREACEQEYVSQEILSDALSLLKDLERDPAGRLAVRT